MQFHLISFISILIFLMAVKIVENRSYNNGLMFYDLKTRRPFLPPTVSVSRGRSLSAFPYSSKGSIWSTFGKPCECTKTLCGCCAGIAIRKYNFDQKICANVTYYNPKDEIHLELFLNEKSTSKYGMSPRNPSPFCIPLMLNIPLAMCIQMTNVGLVGDNLNMCMDFVVGVGGTQMLEMHFQCMLIGLQGAQWVTATGGAVIPPSPAKSEDDDSSDEYFDESEISLPNSNNPSYLDNTTRIIHLDINDSEIADKTEDDGHNDTVNLSNEKNESKILKTNKSSMAINEFAGVDAAAAAAATANVIAPAATSTYTTTKAETHNFPQNTIEAATATTTAAETTTTKNVPKKNIIENINNNLLIEMNSDLPNAGITISDNHVADNKDHHNEDDDDDDNNEEDVDGKVVNRAKISNLIEDHQYKLKMNHRKDDGDIVDPETNEKEIENDIKRNDGNESEEDIKSDQNQFPDKADNNEFDVIYTNINNNSDNSDNFNNNNNSDSNNNKIYIIKEETATVERNGNNNNELKSDSHKSQLKSEIKIMPSPQKSNVSVNENENEDKFLIENHSNKLTLNMDKPKRRFSKLCTYSSHTRRATAAKTKTKSKAKAAIAIAIQAKANGRVNEMAKAIARAARARQARYSSL